MIALASTIARNLSQTHARLFLPPVSTRRSGWCPIVFCRCRRKSTFGQQNVAFHAGHLFSLQRSFSPANFCRNAPLKTPRHSTKRLPPLIELSPCDSPSSYEKSRSTVSAGLDDSSGRIRHHRSVALRAAGPLACAEPKTCRQAACGPRALLPRSCRCTANLSSRSLRTLDPPVALAVRFTLSVGLGAFQIVLLLWRGRCHISRASLVHSDAALLLGMSFFATAVLRRSTTATTVCLQTAKRPIASSSVFGAARGKVSRASVSTSSTSSALQKQRTSYLRRTARGYATMTSPTIKLNNGKEVGGESGTQWSGEHTIDTVTDAACGFWPVEGEQCEQPQSEMSSYAVR